MFLPALTNVSVVTARVDKALSTGLEGPVDLVVLDVRLPGMDGLTALREIARRRPGLPVIEPVSEFRDTFGIALQAAMLYDRLWKHQPNAIELRIVDGDHEFLNLFVPADSFAAQEHDRALERLAQLHDGGDVGRAGRANANLAGHALKVSRASEEPTPTGAGSSCFAWYRLRGPRQPRARGS